MDIESGSTQKLAYLQEELDNLLAKTRASIVNKRFNDSTHLKLHELNEEFDSRINNLTQLFKSSPVEDKFEWIQYRKGQASRQLQQKNQLQAILDYHETLSQVSIEKDPEYFQEEIASLLTNIGLTSNMIQQYEIAITAFRLAHEMDEKNCKVLYNLSKSLLEAKKYQEAIDYCEKGRNLAKNQQQEETLKDFQTLQKSIMTRRSQTKP